MNTRNIVAVILILFGIGMILENLFFMNFSVFQWWPLIIIVIGVKILHSSRHLALGLIVTSVGTIALAYQFDVIDGFWQFMWPALIIILGIQMIIGRKPKRYKHKDKCSEGFGHRDKNGKSDIEIHAILRGTTEEYVVDNLQSAYVSAVMGSAKIDLSQSNFASDVHLDIKAVMGEVVIWLPDNCRVKANGVPILADFKNRTYCDADTDTVVPLVRVDYTSILAEVKLLSKNNKRNENIF